MQTLADSPQRQSFKRYALLASTVVAVALLTAPRSTAAEPNDPNTPPAVTQPTPEPAIATPPAEPEDAKPAAEADQTPPEPQAVEPLEAPPAPPPSDIEPLAGENGAEPTHNANLKFDLMPRMKTPTMTWIAVVLILALILQTRPTWFTWHNLDGLALAAMCVLMAIRADDGVLNSGGFARTAQWWSFVGLTLIGGYFLLRGLNLVATRRVPPFGANVNEGAMCVLVIAAGLVAFQRIAEADYSPASRDGFVGALQILEHGELPYGAVDGHDARSPLVYGAHALAMQVPYGLDLDLRTLRLSDRHSWERAGWWRDNEIMPIRLVNAALFVLLLLGVAGIGHRQHSVAMGQTLVAIACIFPGMLDCLSRPEIMIPTVLMTWSLAFLRVPMVGPLMSGLLLTAAGFGWVWAWLGLPVLIAHEAKRGAAHGVGAVVGSAAALIGGVWLIATFTAPSLPRADGALAAAGIQPRFEAKLNGDSITVASIEPSTPESSMLAPMWRLLLRGGQPTLGDAIAASHSGYKVAPEAASTPLQEIAASGPVRGVIQAGYQDLMAGAAKLERARMSIRTALESTWKPERTPMRGEYNAWRAWLGDNPRAVLVRRIVRIVAALLGLLTALAVMRSDRAEQHRVVGGLLAVMCAAMLAGTTGMVTNLALITPFVLAALAVKTDEDVAVRRRAAGEPPSTATPRITVEAGGS